MFKRIKSLLLEFQSRLKNIELQTREIEWANIYHDSIRGKKPIEELALYVGRWGGNYSFFYILNRVLADKKPTTILEFGLGESSKFISAYLENYLLDSYHTIIEQDENWITSFMGRNKLSGRSDIKHCPVKQISIKGFQSWFYEGLDEQVAGKFDLVIVDGPIGSARYSRYNIMSVIMKITPADDFVIIIDDANRQGEKDTLEDVFSLLGVKKIPYFKAYYSGNKTNCIIVSENNKFLASL